VSEHSRQAGADTPPTGGRTTVMRCEIGACRNSTREQKPFCSLHVEQNTYVRGLLSTLEGQEKEEARVRRSGARAVDSQGLNAIEILRQLRFHGDQTAERLALTIRIDLELVEVYVRALAKENLIFLGRTERGSTIVSLKDPTAAAWAEPKQRARTRERRTAPRSA
jgi:hypothetical protein